MRSTRTLILAAALIAGIAALTLSSTAVERSASDAQSVMVPIFEVDPFWPKPLPNRWVLGSVVGVDVDSRDHVFIIHRQGSLNPRTEVGAAQDPPTGECCVPAPPVLEFDPEGNLVNAWGGPSDEYDWPGSNHGIAVDPMDNVWIGGNGRDDGHILKFSHDGTFLMQIGEPGLGVDSRAEDHFGGVAKIAFDADANEAYVADGYGNKRVAVIDMDTGEMKRYWGAYGNEPSDEDLGRYDPDAPLAQQFRNPVHCAMPSVDDLIYVCDRPNDRIQVFQPDGTFVDEMRIAPATLGDGSTWDIAFSRDADQRYMYVADGKNERIYIVDRDALEILAMFGDGGRQPGQFFAVHSIATDSEGTLYTTETYEGKRVQRFVRTRMAEVTETNMGVPWPEGAR